MALKSRIAELAEAPAEFQSLYEPAANGNGFMLKLDDVNLDGLMSKNAELLAETKAAKSKAAALEQAQADAARKALEDQQQYETLYKQSEAEKAATAAQLEALKQQRLKREREIYLENLIATNGLASDAKRRDMLKRELMDSVNFDENGSVVTDGILIGDRDAVKKAISEQYPFLVDAVQSAGGGAVGGSSAPVNTSANPAADAAKAKGDLNGFLAASLKASLTTTPSQ